jgi:BirA family biotin operon repressor/biotin-[acetyl-CoA-carboxylase] ligase
MANPRQIVGRRMLRLDRVDSTNSVAAEHAADSANDGLVVWAEEQTAGRGRMGRTWQSPPGCGIWLSVLLLPPEALCRPVLVTALAAVSVCETIYDSARLQATIKWPNDVLIQGRKVCGILVEQGRGTILGIGLNVYTPAEAFAAAHLDFAGSLAMFTGAALDREAMVDTLLGHLDKYYTDILSGQLGDLESRWRWHGALLGRQVVLTTNDGTHRGRLVEMNFATMVVQEPQGAFQTWPPEAVVTLTPASR